MLMRHSMTTYLSLAKSRKKEKKKFNDYEYLKDTPTLRGTMMARSVPFKRCKRSTIGHANRTHINDNLLFKFEISYGLTHLYTFLLLEVDEIKKKPSAFFSDCRFCFCLFTCLLYRTRIFLENVYAFYAIE